MSENGSKQIYPATPLEEKVTIPQQQPLLAPKVAPSPSQPPTYQEANEKSTAATAAPNVVIVNVPIYGPKPLDLQCPYCHNFCRTRLRHKPNSRTHMIAILLCLFQMYCCICLPYCIGSCLDIDHYCGICDKYLGTFKR